MTAPLPSDRSPRFRCWSCKQITQLSGANRLTVVVAESENAAPQTRTYRCASGPCGNDNEITLTHDQWGMAEYASNPANAREAQKSDYDWLAAPIDGLRPRRSDDQNKHLRDLVKDSRTQHFWLAGLGASTIGMNVLLKADVTARLPKLALISAGLAVVVSVAVSSLGQLKRVDSADEFKILERKYARLRKTRVVSTGLLTFAAVLLVLAYLQGTKNVAAAPPPRCTDAACATAITSSAEHE